MYPNLIPFVVLLTGTHMKHSLETLGEIDQLHSELDSARGRSAELERKLADALASGPKADAEGNKLEAATQQVGVLTGKLGAAKDKITDLEAQVLAL